MKKLKISDTQRFTIHIEETIDEDNLFFHVYEIAVDNLNIIWDSQKNLNDSSGKIVSENPNNIIAFCGERGSGKSSAMLSFVDALINHKNREDKLNFTEEIKNNDWSTKIIIDPSMFDGVHNIVDIVLAHIYQNFRLFYDKNNQNVEKYEREEMLNLLGKTYKSLSIIKNKEKVLDDEYDVVGNIAKLQNLGESTQLRELFKELIDYYLKIISGANDRLGKKSKKLLIAIDDLDLCNEHAYEMAEQIRKYLILPNVIILMAIKIDQLEMGVEEKNRENFRNIIKGRGGDSAFEQEMRDMAERYVTKLIPKARRIYLPKLENTQFKLELSVNSQHDDVVDMDTVENTVIKMIREKTGMVFAWSENYYNYFLPGNLRELINLITLLMSMRQPNDSEQIKLENIYEFRVYFVEEILKKKINIERLSDLLEVLEGDDNTKNYNMIIYLDELVAEKKKNETHLYETILYEFPNTSLASVVEKLIIISSYLTKTKDYQLFYYIKIYYTILLNERLLERRKISESLFGGFLWGKSLFSIMPAAITEKNQLLLYRERFFINTLTCWNAIAEALNEWNTCLFVPLKDDSQLYVSRIKDENKLSEILCWLLLALLGCANTPTSNGKRSIHRGQVVANNYMVSFTGIAISVENYIANLTSLHDLYDIANLELLGITRKEINKILSAMKEENTKLIEQSRLIAVNVDLSMQVISYCGKHGDYKEAASGDRTYKLIRRFFDNISKYLKKNEIGEINFSEFWIPTSINEQGEVLDGACIDICKVYAKIFEAEENILRGQPSDTIYGGISMTDGQMLKRDFAQQIENIAPRDYTGKIYKIPRSLRNRTSGYVKEVLENIANGVQKYTYKEKKYPDGFDVRQLVNLYSEVVDLFIDDPENNISDRQYEEYKAIAKIGSIIM